MQLMVYSKRLGIQPCGYNPKSDDKNLDQNLCSLLGEEQRYPLDVVENDSAGVGCYRDATSKRQLVMQCHTQILGRQGHHKVPNGDGEVTGGKCLS